MDALTLTAGTQATTIAGLTAGTTTTYTTANTVLYSIKGKGYSKGAVTNGATPTTDAATGAAFVALTASKGCVFVFGFDSGGNIKVCQGPVADLDGATAGSSAYFKTVAPAFPVVPDTICPFGYCVTKVGASGSTWTFGSSNLAGPPSNVLHTFVDVMTMPGRPQVS